MAAATPPTTALVPRTCSSTSILQPKAAATTAFSIPNFFGTASIKRRTSLVRATKPQKETPNSITTNNKPDSSFISQEDVSYLIKLGAGSVVGAAAIKYGSIIFPEITRPNIIQALTMISAPVVVVVLLLIKQSSSD